jgi:hypothetical protein
MALRREAGGWAVTGQQADGISLGTGVRLWQLGIEMRPLFHKRTWIGYPIFASISGAFGYYLEGVEERQQKILEARKQRLLEKRARAKEAWGETGEENAAAALL